MKSRPVTLENIFSPNDCRDGIGIHLFVLRELHVSLVISERGHSERLSSIQITGVVKLSASSSPRTPPPPRH